MKDSFSMMITYFLKHKISFLLLLLNLFNKISKLEFRQMNQIVMFDNDQWVDVNIRNNLKLLLFPIAVDMIHKQDVFGFRLILELLLVSTKCPNVYIRATNLKLTFVYFLYIFKILLKFILYQKVDHQNYKNFVHLVHPHQPPEQYEHQAYASHQLK